MVIITYNLDKKANILVCVSTDGGKTFSAPLKQVSGDVGKGVYAGRKRIVWDVLSERESLVEDRVMFKVVANKEEKPRPTLTKKAKRYRGYHYLKPQSSFYIDVPFAFGVEDIGMGIGLSYVSKYAGFYVDGLYEVMNGGFSIYGGPVVRLIPDNFGKKLDMHLYAGIGYSSIEYSGPLMFDMGFRFSTRRVIPSSFDFYGSGDIMLGLQVFQDRSMRVVFGIGVGF